METASSTTASAFLAAGLGYGVRSCTIAACQRLEHKNSLNKYSLRGGAKSREKRQERWKEYQ